MSKASPCTVVDHPLVKVGVTHLRNRETPVAEFRRVLRDLSMLVGIEASRDLRLSPCAIETPLAPCEGFRHARPIVLLPILRAGLGMAEALLAIFPEARVGHIGLYRDEVTFEPHSYYFKTPDLTGADVFLVDPMLATGQSGADAVDKVKAAGATSLRLLCLIASTTGVGHFHSRHPDVPVYTAALDEGLNEKAYIVPGLGDAGDRYFGTGG